MIQVLNEEVRPKSKPGRPDPAILRTLRRVDKELRVEHKRLGLPLVVWKDGRVQKVKP
jgi:hypothetical protein